jgi:hypothetical protein
MTLLDSKQCQTFPVGSSEPICRGLALCYAICFATRGGTRGVREGELGTGGTQREGGVGAEVDGEEPYCLYR